MASEVIAMLETELANYVVDYRFEHNGTRHPYVLLSAPSGMVGKLTYSPRAVGHNILNLRAQIRREMKRLKVEPRDDRRKAVRLGSLGEALIEAVTPPATSLKPKHQRRPKRRSSPWQRRRRPTSSN